MNSPLLSFFQQSQQWSCHLGYSSLPLSLPFCSSFRCCYRQWSTHSCLGSIINRITMDSHYCRCSRVLPNQIGRNEITIPTMSSLYSIRWIQATALILYKLSLTHTYMHTISCLSFVVANHHPSSWTSVSAKLHFVGLDLIVPSVLFAMTRRVVTFEVYFSRTKAATVKLNTSLAPHCLRVCGERSGSFSSCLHCSLHPVIVGPFWGGGPMHILPG